jgi:hypothetical protein
MGVNGLQRRVQTQTQTLIYQQPIHLNGVSVSTDFNHPQWLAHTEQNEFKLELFRHGRIGVSVLAVPNNTSTAPLLRQTPVFV